MISVMWRRSHAVAFVTLLLLIHAGARILRLGTFELHHDEVWSVWQTFGTPAQIVQWTPYDWAPLYYLVLGMWRGFVGIHPMALRFLSILLGLLAMAVLYRVGRRITRRHEGGVIALLVYGALGYGIYQSVIARGYTLLILAGMLAFWAMLRYFQRPTTARGILLGVALATMLYVHYSAVFAFLAFGLYTLITTPRRLLAWLLPVGVLFILNIPQLPKQINYLVSQSNFIEKAGPQPLGESLRALFVDFAGSAWWVVLVAVVAACIGYGVRRRFTRPDAALGIWAIVPVWLYVLPPLLGLFTDPVTGVYLPRYFWWLVLPAALWLASGIVHAPRWLMTSLALLLIGSVGLTIPEKYQENVPPFMTTFSQLARYAQWGDAVMIDPSIEVREDAYQWEYFTAVYLPSGITFVDEPGAHHRVWYLSVDGRQNPELLAALSRDYMPRQFFGPWNFLFRLYEAPPDREGIAFENGMRFHGAKIVGAPQGMMPAYREGEPLRLRLWWSVDAPIELDYSVGLYLLDAQNRLYAEDNRAPNVADAPAETSRWQPGRHYIDERELVLPSQVVTQVFSLYLSVYQWWDGQRMTADGMTEARLLPLANVQVKTWWLP